MVRSLGVSVLMLGLVVVVLAVFGVPVGDGLRLLWDGAAGDKYGLSRTLVKSVPLLLTGAGMMVAWKGGAYNIGGEGQFVIGGLVGAWFAGFAPPAFPPVLQSFVLAGAIVGGAGWSLLAAWLWIKRSVQPVISTILLNFLALQVLDYCVRGPLQEARRQLPQTEKLHPSEMFVKFDAQTDLHVGVPLAVVLAVAASVWLFSTRSGFLVRATGANPDFVKASGHSVSRSQFLTMAVSGALCGLAGAVEYLGVSGFVGSGFSQGWGYLGIPVALVGGLTPTGVMSSGLFFGALFAGCQELERYTKVGTTLVPVVQAVAVLGVTLFWKIRPRVREAVSD